MSARAQGERSWLWPLVAAVLLALALVAAKLKGGGVDEFWTLAFADARVPFRTAFEAWTLDSGHPVGYYWFARVLDPLLPDTILLSRASNLLFVLPLLALAGWRRRDGFGWLFLCALLAQPYLIERFAEYRAIFGALMAVAAVALAVRAELGRDRLSWRAALPAVALTAAMLLDYPVGLVGVALCAAWAVVALAAGRRAQAGVAVASIAIGLAVMAVGVLNALRYPMLPPAYTQSSAGVIKDMVIMLAVAVAPLGLVAAAGWPTLRRQWLSPGDPLARQRLVLFGLALAATVAGYFVLNLVNHAMIRRQLIGLVPPLTALLCELCRPALRTGNRRLTALAVVNLLAVAAVTLVWLHGKPGFDTFGDRLAAGQRACPTLPVYGVRPQEADGTHTHGRFPGIADPVLTGLPIVARAHDFRVTLAAPRRVDPACGAVIWSEFYWGRAPTPQQLAARVGLTADPAALAASRVEYLDHSFLLVVPGASGRTAFQ